MAATKIKEGKLLYHLTALENLPSIIKRGLIPRSLLLESEENFCDVADSGIINERTQFGLDKYTPFHFHPRTPFDYAVRANNPNRVFVYLCLKRTDARDNDFLILPQHPLSIGLLELFSYDDGFSRIDWDSMEQSSRSSRSAHSVRMAECLTDKIIPIDCFSEIGVKDDEDKAIVENYLNTIRVYVNVRPWF